MVKSKSKFRYLKPPKKEDFPSVEITKAAYDDIVLITHMQDD